MVSLQLPTMEGLTAHLCAMCLVLRLCCIDAAAVSTCRSAPAVRVYTSDKVFGWPANRPIDPAGYLPTSLRCPAPPAPTLVAAIQHSLTHQDAQDYAWADSCARSSCHQTFVAHWRHLIKVCGSTAKLGGGTAWSSSSACLCCGKHALRVTLILCPHHPGQENLHATNHSFMQPGGTSQTILGTGSGCFICM